MHYRYLLVLAVICVLATTQGEIHRVKTSYKTNAKRSVHVQSSEADVAVGRSEMQTGGEETGDSASLRFLLDDKNFRTSYDVWLYSIGGAILVGLSGILPLLIMPLEAGPSLMHGGESKQNFFCLQFCCY
jgi:hypothetical protein